MYYVMQNPVGFGETLATFQSDPRFHQSWISGARFDTSPPVPLELEWVPEDEAGRKVAYYSHGPVLMTKLLTRALEEAGVDNLDTYPVVIHSSTGLSDCHDYLAVNVIGALAAADMNRSVVLDAPDGPLLTVIFDSLVINEAKTHGQLLFRLAEAISTIIVHESVVRHLESRGGFGLTFLNPVDFVG